MVTHGQFHPAFKVKITLILHKLSQKLQKREIHTNLFYEGSITEILKYENLLQKEKNPQSFANQSQQYIKRKYIMFSLSSFILYNVNIRNTSKEHKHPVFLQDLYALLVIDCPRSLSLLQVG